MYYVNLVLKHMGFQQPEEPHNPEMQNLLHIIKFKFVAPRGYINPTEQLILNNQKRYDSSQLDRFTELCNDNTPLETIFEELGFPISPNQQILNEIRNQIAILKNPSNSQIDFDFNQILFTPNSNNANSNSNPEKSNSNAISDILIYGALHQGIAWIANMGNHNLDFAVDLISIFLDFINSPPIHSKIQIIQHINCVFSLMIKGFLNDYSLDVTDPFVAAVLAFLVGSYSISENFSDIFNSFFSKVINSGLPRSISHILRVTQQFIDEHRPFIQIEETPQNNTEPDQNQTNTNTHSSLFKVNVLEPLIRSLDSNLIELICIGSTSTNKFLENVRVLLDLLATSICQNIIESENPDSIKNSLEVDNSPDLKVPEIENDYTFLKEDIEIKDLKYNSSELTSLAEIINKPSRNIKDYLPTKANNVIVLISVKFATMNAKYLESFLTIIGNTAIENLGKPHYIDLYSVLIFLFEKLSGKFTLSSFKSSFLSPVIFNTKYSIFNILPDIIIKGYESLKAEIETEKDKKEKNEINDENTNDIKINMNDETNKFLIISDFRYFIFNIISMNSQTLLYQLLNYASSKSPYLFSEQLLRIYFNMSKFKIEFFCSENIHELILNSSYQLQQLYISDPSNMTRLSRISIFNFYFTIIEDSTAFLLSSSSSFFSKCFFHFLFEPSLKDLFIEKLTKGFTNSHISFTIPAFVKFIPSISEILDYISSTKSNLIIDERYTKLANQIIQCITDSLNKNKSLIHSFFQAFLSILHYVWKNPSQQLLQECFSFLSILSQSSSSFCFSSEMFQLLSDIIRAVEGKEPSLQTKLTFYGMMSGSNQTSEDALFLIKSPQFIPLILVSYSQSTSFIKLIEYFASLCKYSSSNCVACYKGDLDFLLLQILKYDNSFEYNGYKVDFLIDLAADHYKGLGTIFNLISHIVFVKTNVVIVDQLIKLTLPISPYFQPQLASSILLLMLNLITTEVNKKKPTFDIYLNKPICQIKGLTDKEINGNITISFWVKLDIPLLLSLSEPLMLFSIENVEKSISFIAFVNGESLFCSFKNAKAKNASSKPLSIKLIEQVPSNEWVLFSFDILKQQSDNRTCIYFYKFKEQVGFATFNNFNFPQNSKIIFTFGANLKELENSPIDSNLNEKSIINGNSSISISNYKIIGQLGPFCIFDPQSDSHSNKKFPFVSDPNFEKFKSAIITSSNIIEYYLSMNDYQIKNKKDKFKINKNKNITDDNLELKMQRFEIKLSNLAHCGDCLNDVLFYVYDLNYLTYILTLFTPKDNEISIQVLEMILTCLSTSALAQKKYISAPILAKSIPIVFKGNLNFKLYLTFFNALTAFKYEPLIKEFLDLIIFNFELWGSADIESIIRIMNHWATSVYDMFTTTKSSFLKVSRLLAVLDIVFFSESTPESISNDDESQNKNDFGAQTDFSLQEMRLLHSFSINHTKEEVEQVKGAYLNFIEFYVQKSISTDIVSTINYHLFESTNKEKTIALLKMMDHIGTSVKTLPAEYQLKLVKPLQYFFNTNDIDIIIPAILALCSLSSQNSIHLLLSTASIQIQLNSDFKAVFYRLLPHVKERCNLYSLVCVLSLSLGQEEQNKAVLILKELLNNPQLSQSVEQSTFWSIWPIILGLYNTDYGSKIKFKGQDPTIFQTNLAIISEFFANQILRFLDIINEFKNFLSVIHLLANDWKTASFELESELTFVLSKHIFASTIDKIVKIRGPFLRMAFNSIFFSNIYHRNRALFYEYSQSPFYHIQIARRATLPLNNIYETLPKSKIEPSENNQNQVPPLNVNVETSNNNDNYDPKQNKLRANSSFFEDIVKKPKSSPEKVHQSNDTTVIPPIDSFMSFANFNQVPVSSSVSFQLRIDEENRWIDSKLCSTLVSMIPCVEKPHQTIPIFKDVIDFVRINYPEGKDNEIDSDAKAKLKTNLIFNTDIQSKISTLQENAISFSSKFVYTILFKAFETAQKLIFDSLSKFSENRGSLAIRDIEKELNRVNSHQCKYKETLSEIEKTLVYPRTPQLILQLYKKQKQEQNKEDTEIISTYFKRDNCSCFDLCPVKTKPVIKEKSFKIWELRQTHSNENDSKIFADVETQTEYVDDDSESDDHEKFPQYANSKYFLILPCKIIKATKTKDAIFLLSSYKMCLIATNSNSKYMVPLNDIERNNRSSKLPKKVTNIQFHKIMSIFKRKRYQKGTAIEIFLINGETYLIDFDPVDNDQIMNKLADHPLLSMQQVQRESTSSFFLENKQRTTSLWASGQMSNFTYLMALNTFSGRTFNDIFQYPIFPLITRDVRTISRNLSFPLSYQPKKKENKEEEEVNEEQFEDSIFLEIEQMFHTSPVPSSTVEDCLIRIEPFTSYYLMMQSGRFKHDKKIVSSLDLFDNCELPPEFYFCPEIFINNNRIKSIPDFRFDEKNYSNSFELVYKHRKLLESDEVSAKLHKWIDLIWGCKQSGQLALKYRNYLHPFILQDVWEREASLLVEAKRQVLSMMHLYGIMPQQLFTDLHPPRMSKLKDEEDEKDEEEGPNVVQKKIHSIPLIYASCIADNCFLTIDSRGKVITCMINLSSPELITKEISKSPLKIAPGTVTCPIEKGLIFLSQATETLSIFQYGSLHTYKFFTANFIEINVKNRANTSMLNSSTSLNASASASQNIPPTYAHLAPTTTTTTTSQTAATATTTTTSQTTATTTTTTNATTAADNENTTTTTTNTNNEAPEINEASAETNNNNSNNGGDNNNNDNNDESSNEGATDANAPPPPTTTNDANSNINENDSLDPGTTTTTNATDANTDSTTTTNANTNASANVNASANANASASDIGASGTCSYDGYYETNDDFEVFIHANLANDPAEGDFDPDDDASTALSATGESSDFIFIDGESELFQFQHTRMVRTMSMMTSSNSMFTNFDSIYGSQKYFLIVKDRSIVNVYDTLTFPQKLGEIVILDDAILHCQVSQQFNVIAILSRSGLIHIHSLSNLQKTAVIDLSNGEIDKNGEISDKNIDLRNCVVGNNSAILNLNYKKPKRMVITPRWCFIVVDFGYYRFEVYSVNGIKIKEAKIDVLEKNTSSIYSWCAVSSLKDFDYVIFVDTKGNIGYFEAFDPSNTKILTNTNSIVCHMDYCRSEDCIYILTTQGNIIFIGHPFDSKK